MVHLRNIRIQYENNGDNNSGSRSLPEYPKSIMTNDI